MTPGWQYQEARAAPPLARHVAAFWQMQGTTHPGPDAVLRVLPDGCLDVIFDLGVSPGISIVGTMTTAITVALVPGMNLFGIRFRPGGALPWLRVPADELTDTSADPRDCALHAPAWLLDSFMTNTSLDSRVRSATQWLLHEAKLGEAKASVYAAARMLAQEAQSVSEAARQLGMSERTLQRSFQRDVGITPVEYRRVARLRRLVSSLSASGVTLADAAVDAGYYDQPHLDREFRRLVGCAPRQWLATRVGFLQDATIECL